MSNRAYRLILGAFLLAFLNFDWSAGIYVMIVVLFLEGITNLRIPMLVNKLRYGKFEDLDEEEFNFASSCSINLKTFSSERMWRLVVGTLLFISYILFSEQWKILPIHVLDGLAYVSWFFPWFMGFAIFGAGISGVCPVLISIKWCGFR